MSNLAEFAHYMSAMVALLKWEAVEVERMSTPASIKSPMARER